MLKHFRLFGKLFEDTINFILLQLNLTYILAKITAIDFLVFL